MKKLLLHMLTGSLLVLLITGSVKAQDTSKYTEKVLRINVFNPAIEYEFPVFDKSTISTSLGVGMEGAYKNLAEDPSLPYYNYFMFAPVADARYRKFYDLDKRASLGKNTSYNAGNFFGARLLIRGPEIYSAFTRTDQIDFSMGPLWGLQRSFGVTNIQFDLGPMYYFDTKGNSGIMWLMLDLNIGFNLRKF